MQKTNDVYMEKPKTFKISNAHKWVKRIFWTLVLIGLASFFGKVAMWESQYYKEKEGSERVAAGTVGDVNASQEVDHVVVTDQMKNEHIVPADHPRFMTIEKLGIYRARITELGVLANGQMEAPNNDSDVGWYNGSALPGHGDTSVFDGHAGVGVYPGVFSKLSSLSNDDIIEIEMGNGTIYKYAVHDNFTVKLEDANSRISLAFKTPVVGKESISIITCTGEYSLSQNTYTSRQFLRATLIN